MESWTAPVKCAETAVLAETRMHRCAGGAVPIANASLKNGDIDAIRGNFIEDKKRG
jgi:hypothetical protein